MDSIPFSQSNYELWPDQESVDDVTVRDDPDVNISEEERNLLRELRLMSSPHVNAFNWVLENGLRLITEEIGYMYRSFLRDDTGYITVGLRAKNLELYKPRRGTYQDNPSKPEDLWPSHCRDANLTYGSDLSGTFELTFRTEHKEFKDEHTDWISQGVPIMVGSHRCHLAKFQRREQFEEKKEELMDFGGYFILNGNDRVVRQIGILRRNTPFVRSRKSNQARGVGFTEYSATLRSVRRDESWLVNNIYMKETGALYFQLRVNTTMSMLPIAVILHALIPTTDADIVARILSDCGDKRAVLLGKRCEHMMRDAHLLGIHTQKDAITFIAKTFRGLLLLPHYFSDQDLCDKLIKESVFVHLDSPTDKYHLAIFMIKKLYAVHDGLAAVDNDDRTHNIEVLGGAQVWLMALKDHLIRTMRQYLRIVANALQTLSFRLRSAFPKGFMALYLKKVRDMKDIGAKIASMLATGNAKLSTVQLPQMVGLTVSMDRLNALRSIAQLRGFHLGERYAEMRGVTHVRRLRPESYGFLCPVHTPDGAPCGLLCHLTHDVIVTCSYAVPGLTPMTERLCRILERQLLEFNFISIVHPNAVQDQNGAPVFVDGKLLGFLSMDSVVAAAHHLRLYRALYDRDGDEDGCIPDDVEIVGVPPHHQSDADGDEGVTQKTGATGSYCALYVFSGAARFMRPVYLLQTGTRAYIGVMEQLFLDVACRYSDARPGITTHIDEKPTSMLSLIAALTPFSDLNQSPRNMYQCQMGKQTMGTPGLALRHRNDKLYRLTTLQRPLVSTEMQDRFCLDSYPTGFNAVVAVLSYTGYDMEDAMIINKQAMERGLAHGCVQKVRVIDLDENVSASDHGRRYFCNLYEGGGTQHRYHEGVDADGLPSVGQRVKPGQVLAVYYSEDEMVFRALNYTGTEEAQVVDVKMIGHVSDAARKPIGTKPESCANTRKSSSCAVIVFRCSRNPVIGDKFSSRHGQKGTLSQLWPHESMPFTESGMVPDIIINPHAFPSRMTIGMLVESMAGKATAQAGFHAADATPFQFSEEETPVDFFGEQLVKCGYNFYGNEPMYSGVTGTEMRADIFFGLVYYQRLRHMVSDKWQARATGRVNDLTKQPVGGRKRGGGVRFGEMERDALLAHGTSSTLSDRLMYSSDYHRAVVCSRCGTIVAAHAKLTGVLKDEFSSSSAQVIRYECRQCGDADACKVVALPYAFRYLLVELAAMNINCAFGVKLK